MNVLIEHYMQNGHLPSDYLDDKHLEVENIFMFGKTVVVQYIAKK